MHIPFAHYKLWNLPVDGNSQSKILKLIGNKIVYTVSVLGVFFRFQQPHVTWGGGYKIVQQLLDIITSSEKFISTGNRG